MGCGACQKRAEEFAKRKAEIEKGLAPSIQPIPTPPPPKPIPEWRFATKTPQPLRSASKSITIQQQQKSDTNPRLARMLDRNEKIQKRSEEIKAQQALLKNKNNLPKRI